MNVPFVVATYNSGRLYSFCTTPLSIQTPTKVNFFPHGATAPNGPGPPHYRSFTVTLRASLDEGSDRFKDVSDSTHKTQTSVPLAGFEPTIPTSERSKTHALDRVATGTGRKREIHDVVTYML